MQTEMNHGENKVHWKNIKLLEKERKKERA